MTKTCSKCKRVLPKTDFYTKGKGILRSECKTCFKQYRTFHEERDGNTEWFTYSERIGNFLERNKK